MTTSSLLRGPRAATLGALAAAGLGFALLRGVRCAEPSAKASAHCTGSGPVEVAKPAGRQNMLKPIASSRVFSSGLSMVSLRLKSSEEVTHDVKRLRFEFPDPEAVSGLSVTSSLLTVSWPHDSFFPTLRPYTPVSRLDVPGHLDLLVKRYPNGKASTYLHSLKPGQSLRFVAALPGYPWTPNQHPHVVLIAGGAGITPIYQLVQAIFLQNRDDKTRATLVFGANNDRDVLLKAELDAIQEKFPDRFKVVYTVSNPEPGSPFQRGRVTKELLAKVLDDDEAARAGTTKVLICGPPAMESALVGTRRRFGRTPGILEELGFRKDQICTF
ncbi:ferredoxin reductase-like protein [Parathielavia appendiculata]|uniref:NADH-cytochrome b5 reductase n=1 Tax=Parathielavia appendiculata TaxID=2587402 RepID=A0AAN6U0F2_9PEZI|nr:ferredoxin reductase-like protein [Parathielavia appendiculata]